jgi:phosphatidylserine decarboxylase
MNSQNWSKIIHKEGYVFILLFAVATFLLSSFSSFLGFIGLVLTCWCVYFFRNPDRMVIDDENNIVCPADGVIQTICEAIPPKELDLPREKMLRVSIFLSVFNVHVNRVPATGKITQLSYHPGKFLNASLDKASVDNERQSILMETSDGTKIGFVQIAGLIARRIVCNLEEGEEVKVGQRFGIIRFGSRMDVYLPHKTIPLVSENQVAVGGETVIAKLNSDIVSAPKFETR